MDPILTREDRLDRADANLEQGQRALELGDLHRARLLTRQALVVYTHEESDSTDVARAHYLLAQAALRAGETEQARHHLSRLLAYQPDHADARQTLEHLEAPNPSPPAEPESTVPRREATPLPNPSYPTYVPEEETDEETILSILEPDIERESIYVPFPPPSDMDDPSQPHPQTAPGGSTQSTASSQVERLRRSEALLNRERTRAGDSRVSDLRRRESLLGR